MWSKSQVRIVYSRMLFLFLFLFVFFPKKKKKKCSDMISEKVFRFFLWNYLLVSIYGFIMKHYMK